jgi:hypothetical protein
MKYTITQANPTVNRGKVILNRFLKRLFISLMFRTQFAQRLSRLEKNHNILTNYVCDKELVITRFNALLSYLQIKIPVGQDLVRIGPTSDGGYVLANNFNAINAVISLGVGRNVDIEMYFANLGKDILLFDGTITNLPKNHKKFNFFNSNVYGTSAFSREKDSEILVNDIFSYYLKNLFKDLAIVPSNLEVLFFVDIEGSEYDLLINLSRANLEVCQQITVEFHDIFKEITSSNSKIFECLAKLHETHELISAHGNNYGAAIQIDGADYPDVLETTWMRKDTSEFVNGVNNFNPRLNKPNNPGAPELVLDW